MRINLDVVGMGCTSCASKIEKNVKLLKGVESVSVSFVNNSAVVVYDEEVISCAEIIRNIEKLGYNASVGRNREKLNYELKRVKVRVVFSLIFAFALFYVSMADMLKLPYPDVFFENTRFFVVLQVLLLLPIIFLNFKYYKNGFRNLIHFPPNMDSLIALSTSSSLLYSIYSMYGIFKYNGTSYLHGIYFESIGTILAIVSLGKYLEFIVKEKARTVISKLVDLSPKTTTVLRDNKETVILTKDVKVGDIIIIPSGQAISGDGVVIEGSAAVDEAMLTGESLPVLKQVGSRVSQGTINTNGYIKVRVEKVGEDTSLFQIIKLVENVSMTKAPIGKIADKISGVFTPFVLLVSLITFVVWFLLTGDIDTSLSFAISVMVVSCPCALGLATPVSIIVANGRGAEIGILFKSSEILEKACLVDTVIFDKTGTITSGQLRVDKIIPTSSITQNEILSIASSLEKLSSHPIAKAIVSKAESEGLKLNKVSDFKEEIGEGISGTIGDTNYQVGNRDWLLLNKISISSIEEKYRSEFLGQKIIVFLSDGEKILGIITINDFIRNTSIKAVEQLKEMGKEVVMLTGDNGQVSRDIAGAVGIEKVISNVSPIEKEKVIRELQSKGKNVAFVGDGINDAPSLIRANIGIAIGAGSDIALESSDIVLMKNNILDVATAIIISVKTKRNIKQNLFWALIYNCLFIPIASGLFSFAGLTFNPIFCAFAMGCSSLFVLFNALSLKSKIKG